MARTLHIVELALAMLSGCFLPPSLSVDTQDAQTDSPPAITAISIFGQPVAENSTIDFTQNQADQNTMTLSLVDTDLDDTLYVGVFVNYEQNPSPARVTCTAGPSSSPQRTASCNMMPLCQSKDVGQPNEAMTVVVFDRQPLQAGNPPYQGTNGGLSTQWFFQLDCQAPS